MNLQKNVSVRETPVNKTVCHPTITHYFKNFFSILLAEIHGFGVIESNKLYELIFLCLACSQATAVLTSKHFAQRQPWWHCGAATPRSTAAVSNWSWMSPLLSWGLVTSARPWGQSSQPPRGPWLPQAEPCPQPSGPCWPTLSPWCWKLCSESSPMLSVLTGTTHMVSYLQAPGFQLHLLLFTFMAATSSTLTLLSLTTSLSC